MVTNSYNNSFHSTHRTNTEVSDKLIFVYMTGFLLYIFYPLKFLYFNKKGAFLFPEEMSMSCVYTG